MFIDSHAHLVGEESEIEELLLRAEKANISSIINICCDSLALSQGLSLCNRKGIPKIYLAAAKTPHDQVKDESFFLQVKEQAKNKNLVAIGETGLDYFYKHTEKKDQEIRLRSYLHLAVEYNLPVIIHCRDAFSDFYDIYQDVKMNEKELSGVLHCFTGTKNEVKKGLDLGLYISFSGMVTYPKNHDLREVASYVPCDRLLIETDSPYLAPQTYRGKKNEPAYLVETAKVVAETKALSLESLRDQTANNCKTLFNIRE